MADYQDKIKELRKLEKDINIENNEYNKKITAGENTIHFEGNLLNKLNSFKEQLQQLEQDYKTKANSDIRALNVREYDMRVKEIHNLLMNHDRMRMKFDSLKNKNYSYKGNTDKYDDYQEDENMKNMGTEELLKYQEEKIKNQDEQVEEIIGEVKKGKKIARQIGEDLKDQNEKLDVLEKDTTKLDTMMKRAQDRMEKLLDKSSNCCLFLVMFLELAIMIIVIVMWKYKGSYLFSKECPES